MKLKMKKIINISRCIFINIFHSWIEVDIEAFLGGNKTRQWRCNSFRVFLNRSSWNFKWRFLRPCGKAEQSGFFENPICTVGRTGQKMVKKTLKKMTILHTVADIRLELYFLMDVDVPGLKMFLKDVVSAEQSVFL